MIDLSRGGRSPWRVVSLLILALPLVAAQCFKKEPLDPVEGLQCRFKYGQIDLIWRRHDLALSYRVKRNDGEATQILGEVEDHAYTDHAFTEGVTYHYTVQARLPSSRLTPPTEPCTVVAGPPAGGGENQPPFFVSTPGLEAEVGAPYAYDADADDPDGDTLAYTLDTAPAGMTIDPATGLVAWTPDETQPGTHAVTVRATDPGGLFATQTFEVVVPDPPAVNQPPFFVSTPGLEAEVGAPYAYDADADDPDGDTLAYTLDTAPAGMTIDPATGLVAWTPDETQPGTHAVTVRATDPGGLFATQTFEVVVPDPPLGNQPPVVQTLLAASARPPQRFETFFGEDANRTWNPATLADDPVRPVSLPNTTVMRDRFLRELEDTRFETFDDFAGGVLVTSLDFGDLTASLTSDARTRLQPVGTHNGTYPTSGSLFLFSDAGSVGTLSLEFDAPVGAFGLAVTDAGDGGGQLSLLIEHEDGPPSEVVIPHTIDVGNPSSGSAFFFGMITTDRPIVAVELSNNNATVDGFGIDDLVVARPDQVLSGIFEGETAALAPATFTDAEAGQTHTATVQWLGDPVAPGALEEDAGAGTVTSRRSYLDDADSSVDVCVTDSEGATGCDTTIVEVQNLPPSIECSLSGFRLLGVLGDGTIVENDPLTGVQTVIAQTGRTGWGALDWHPQRSVLYGVVDASTDPTLAILDPTTGAFQEIGRIMLEGVDVGFLEGMAFDPVSGQLIAAVSEGGPAGPGSFTSELLVSLDPDTAEATRIGAFDETSALTTSSASGDGDADDIDFAGAQLLLVDAQGGGPPSTSALVRVERESGATDIVVDGHPSNVTTIAFDDSIGALYGGQAEPVPALHRIDPATGTTTLIQQGTYPGELAVIPPAAATRLLAVTSTGILHEVDPVSGVPTELGDTGLTGFQAMQWDPQRRTLFAITGVTTVPFSPTLSTIDAVTGEGREIGPITVNGVQVELAEGLAIDPVSGEILVTADPSSGGIDGTSETLLVVDVETGEGTPIAVLGSTQDSSGPNQGDGDGIVFRGSELFLLDGNLIGPGQDTTTLYSVDRGTGAVQEVAVFDGLSMPEIATVPETGISYGVGQDLEGRGVFRVTFDGGATRLADAPLLADITAVPGPPCSTGGLYAISEGELLLYDLGAGSGRNFGSIEFEEHEVTPDAPEGTDSLVFDPVRGVLFASYRTPEVLARIDPQTGLATEVGPFDLTTGGRATAVCGLSWNPADGQLYGVYTTRSSENPCDEIGRVDATSGAITPITTLFQTDPLGDFGSLVDGDAIEWIDGTLYAVDASDSTGTTLLYEVDLSTGFADVLGEIGEPGEDLFLFGLAHAEPLGVSFGASSTIERLVSFDLAAFESRDRFPFATPTFDIAFAVPASFRGATAIAEGEASSLTLRFTDPGVLDTHSGTIDWGDGAVEPAHATSTNGSGFVGGTHVYAQEGSYEATFCVHDDDGGEDCTTVGITAFNAAPAIAPLDDLAIDLGEVAGFEATFTDAGRDDVHIATVDWGDGAAEEVLLVQDSGGGAISGSHTYAEGGAFDAELCVDDGSDLACAVFSVLVNGPPTITSAPPTETVPGASYVYPVQVADDLSADFTFSLDAAPAGMSIDAGGLVSWTPAAGQLGDHTVTVRATDEGGLAATQSYSVAVVVDAVPPSVSVDVSADRVDPGETLVVTVAASDNGAAPTVVVTVNGVEVPLDENGQAVLPTGDSGVLTIVVTVTDASGNTTIETTAVAVTDPADVTPPVAALESPNDLAEVTYLEDLIGTASDANFFRYQVGLSRGGDGPFSLIAEGFAPVVSQVLTTLDATLLENGLHRIRLVAEDVNGQTAAHEIAVAVDGAAKLGPLTLSFVDLALPVAGVPITVVRSYDSRVKERRDFGVGWTLEVRRGSFESNRPIGSGWLLEQSGPFDALCQQTTETRSHLTEVRLSDREAYRFAPQLTGEGVLIGGCTGGVSFQQVDGNTPGATLQILSGSTVLTGPGDQLLDVDTFLPFDVDRVRLTTIDGRIFDFDRTAGGLVRVADSNGNELQVSSGGVVHSSGASISFTRDASDRIVGITDPLGRVLEYEYDAAGDLVASLDRATARTTYTYDGDHRLLTLEGPDGVTDLTAEYDGDGRVAGATDANGNRGETTYDLAAHTQTLTDALGHETVVVFDEHGNVTRREQSVTIDGAVMLAATEYAYDGDDNETAVVDPDDVRVERVHDVFGNVLEETLNPSGAALSTLSSYNASRRIVTFTTPDGLTTFYTYDGSGNVVAVDPPGAGSWTVINDEAGLPIEGSDPGGSRTLRTYDANGFEIALEIRSAIDALISRTESTRDANGNRLTRSVERLVGGVPTAAETRFEYGPLDQITRVVDALGGETLSEYDARGLLVARTDPLGRTTRFEYDAVGDLVRTELPDGTNEQIEYDAVGNRVGETDRAGRETRFEYDELRRLVRTIHPDGSTERRIHTPAGRLAATVDANGNRTDFEYDPAGRRVLAQLPAVFDAEAGTFARPEQRFEYDAAGRRVAEIDARGQRTEFAFDAEGQPAFVTHPDGNVSETVFDANGRVAGTVDEEGRTTAFAYDAESRLSSVELPPSALGEAAAVTTYEYDELGSRTAATDALGRRTDFVSDALGRRTGETLPGTAAAEFEYDAAGNRTARTDFNRDRVTFDYDLADRLVGKSFPDGSDVEYTYTPTGQRASATDVRGLTQYEYDVRDRLTRVVHPGGEAVDYAWDANGNLVTVATPGGALAYEYDALDRLVAVDGPGGRTAYEYDRGGNLLRAFHPNGVVTERTYDGRGRLLTVEHRDAGGALLDSFSYSLSPTGRREQVVEGDGSVVTWTYDERDRLIGETRTGSDPYAITWEYDAVGNRTRRVRDGVETLYLYDADDRLVSEAGVTFDYDENGNLVRSARGGQELLLDWDFENRLVEATNAAGVTGFGYDADGLLAERSGAAGDATFLQTALHPSGFAQVLEEDDAAGTRFHSHGLGFLGTTSAAGSLYAHADGQRSTRLLTDGAGAVTDAYTYDAFGALVAADGPSANAWGYAGERFDAGLGTYDLRARHYDPDAGRFLGRDPFEGFERDPVSRHPYLYAHADPTNRRDPSGRFTLIELASSTGFSSVLQSVALEAVLGFVNIRIAKGLGEKVLAPSQRLFEEVLFANIDYGGLPGPLFQDTLTIARLGSAVGYGSVGFNLALPDLGLVGAFRTDPPLRRLAAALETRRREVGRLGLSPAPTDLENAMDEAIDQWREFCSVGVGLPGEFACAP